MAKYKSTHTGRQIDSGVTKALSIAGTNDGTNWTSLTIGTTTYNIPTAILTYIKTATSENNTLTLTLQDDTTVTFTPANIESCEPKTQGTYDVSVGSDGITVEKQITTTDENGATNDIDVTDVTPLVARANGGLVLDANDEGTLAELGLDYTGAVTGEVLSKSATGSEWIALPIKTATLSGTTLTLTI